MADGTWSFLLSSWVSSPSNFRAVATVTRADHLPQQTAALLFSEYICLAILSFPWSYSVLGLVPGVILTIATAASVQYTSLVLWRYCLAHPEIRDVCDIGKALFNGSKIAYNLTAVGFVLNNTFIGGESILTAGYSDYLNIHSTRLC